ncbi:MAG: MmgE/PrpD family protein [Alphaproteobacteria bacterium]|nr:MmgE/PrpD family protein [Alphaproteobacteria bacterium]
MADATLRSAADSGAAPQPGEILEGLTRRLAAFAVTFRLDQAPREVLDNARAAILDCIGVSILAVPQEIGQAVLAFARDEGMAGPCTVWGTPVSAGARDAALCNGTLAHGLDYDDRNHSSTYSLAAPLALAEQHGLSGARVLEGFIVGRELRNCLDAIFVSRGSGIGPGAKGWHSNGILGPLAAAGAACRVLDLDIDETLAALGLAAGSCGALTRDGGTMAKPYRCGHAAATGVTAALLARHGFSSDDTVLEGRFGLLEAVGPLPDSILKDLAAGLGRSFNLSSPLRGKRFASCTASHSGIEAMLRLRAREKLRPGDVVEIACDLKPYPLVRRNPKRGVEGRFSLPFCLALAVINGDVTPHDFTDAHVADAGIQRLIGLTRHDPGSERLTVTLSDGRRLEEPLAPPANIQGWDSFAEKFLGNVEGILGEGRAAAAVEQVASLENLGSVGDLTDNLRT